VESRALWQQDLAVEMSMSFGGLGAWHGDMTPFADEGEWRDSDSRSTACGLYARPHSKKF
jgi:hypothetical protein